MVIETKQTYIAYHCPHCGFAIYGAVGQMSLLGDMMKIKCQCEEGSELTINYTSDKKIRLSVPCLFCHQNHNYVVSQNIFFGGELFLLGCPYAPYDICFIGPKEEVDRAIEENEKQLNELFAEWEISSLEELNGGRDAADMDRFLNETTIYDIVRFLVRELEADGAIDCPCHGGSYDFDMSDEGVVVFCPHCGAEYIFPTTSTEAAQEFLQCDRLTLTIPNGEDN